MHDAIILRDRQGVIVFWNRGAEKLFGWTSDEALGKQANTLLHTQFLQPLEAIESEVLRAGHWEGELIRIHRDGTPLVVISRWDLWRDDDTSPIIVEISIDVTERKQVERSQRLLAEAGPVLAASLDATSRLATIAQVVVPLLADWCVVHITDEGQTIQPVAVAHADPQKQAQANDLLRRHPPDPDVPPGAAHVLRTGKAELYAEASEELLAAIARDAEQIELVRSLGIKSAMIVPLVTRGLSISCAFLLASILSASSCLSLSHLTCSSRCSCTWLDSCSRLPRSLLILSILSDRKCCKKAPMMLPTRAIPAPMRTAMISLVILRSSPICEPLLGLGELLVGHLGLYCPCRT